MVGIKELPFSVQYDCFVLLGNFFVIIPLPKDFLADLSTYVFKDLLYELLVLLD